MGHLAAHWQLTTEKDTNSQWFPCQCVYHARSIIMMEGLRRGGGLPVASVRVGSILCHGHNCSGHHFRFFKSGRRGAGGLSRHTSVTRARTLVPLARNSSKASFKRSGERRRGRGSKARGSDRRPLKLLLVEEKRFLREVFLLTIGCCRFCNRLLDTEFECYGSIVTILHRCYNYTYCSLWSSK